MYQVIARKYRPQTFAELIGQEHVKTTIENAISQRRIAHGYIFAGQRGTGKTTVARILARCLNCLEGPTPRPCGVCASCIETPLGSAPDVIEIDAASNRGINEMRELRDNVRYRPARDRYKVFIIDEAHQITSEAFNALLKTLEEPPEWVVFILCTTEVHKFPTTIASRCQQFSFRSVDFTEVVSRMNYICGEEGIQADPEALAAIAQAGEGSVRDSLSALDQAIACCGNTLNAAEVRALLGMFSLDSLGQVTEALLASDTRRMLDVVLDLERNGRSLQHFCRELARFFRNLLVVKVAGSNTRLVAAAQNEQERMAEVAVKFSEEDLTRYLQVTLDIFKDLQTSIQPRLHLELGLLKLVYAARMSTVEAAIANLGGAKVVTPPPPRAAVVLAPPPPAPAPIRQAAPAPAPPPQASGPWRDRIHTKLVEMGFTFTADAIEHSQVTETNGEIQFVTTEEFELSMNEKDLQKAVQQIAGKPMKIKIIIGQPEIPQTQMAKPKDDVSERALAHPEVRRFQELFPDAQVRAVRNLKE
jgi:DNA polymerase-3 subunit gamma/tau